MSLDGTQLFIRQEQPGLYLLYHGIKLQDNTWVLGSQIINTTIDFAWSGSPTNNLYLVNIGENPSSIVTMKYFENNNTWYTFGTMNLPDCEFITVTNSQRGRSGPIVPRGNQTPYLGITCTNHPNITNIYTIAADDTELQLFQTIEIESTRYFSLIDGHNYLSEDGNTLILSYQEEDEYDYYWDHTLIYRKE
jgi:hypothetical protein